MDIQPSYVGSVLKSGYGVLLGPNGAESYQLHTQQSLGDHDDQDRIQDLVQASIHFSTVISLLLLLHLKIQSVFISRDMSLRSIYNIAIK